MKKILLTLLVLIGLQTQTQAQDTLIQKGNMFTMVGMDIGLPVIGRGFINPNITLPQRITDEYYIIHYLAGGYSFLDDKQDEYVFSYGVGIPLYTLKKGILYGYLIDAYHYRPNKVVIDTNKKRDFRQRRVKISYRNNQFEFSTTYTLRYSLILGVSYSFKK
tara:strand:+ start:41 stop:526 length:486 start_codon:yes stop_codon:yes gene_type:complete